MLLAFGDCKDDFNIRIKSVQIVLLIVDTGFEVNAIHARLQNFDCRKEMFAASVHICGGFIERRPFPIGQASESDRNACGWSAQRGVENVC